MQREVPLHALSHAAAAALASQPAWHATDAELADIGEQIRQLKETYEARIQALEQRLKDAEAKSAAAPAAAPSAAAAGAEPVGSTAAATPAAPSSGISAFNPAISAVL